MLIYGHEITLLADLVHFKEDVLLLKKKKRGIIDEFHLLKSLSELLVP